MRIKLIVFGAEGIAKIIDTTNYRIESNIIANSDKTYSF